jgi:hypothetical protein
MERHMGKSVWLIGALALLGILAVVGWQRSLDRRPDAERPSAAPVVPKTISEKHNPPQELRSEPTPKPAQTAASSASDSSYQATLAGVDMSWQAAAGLPAQVRAQLLNSDDRASRELLERNRRLIRARDDDAWGPGMQDRLNEFLESIPETENMLITVACREEQCQVQAMSAGQTPSGSTISSQAIFDQLGRQWWVRDQLTLAQGHVTTVDGRLYQVQYFDRKK